MPDTTPRGFDQVVFDSGLVRVGAFRCQPSHPCFHDSGPAKNYCFVFPRTAVEIQHEHERAFVANPNVVTFYNKGQAYLRNAVSAEGDRCDWFGVGIDVVQDVVRTLDPQVDAHPEKPFRLMRGWTDSETYLLQRRVFEQVVSGKMEEPLAVEELVVDLLERVVRSAYQEKARTRPQTISSKQRDVVHHAEIVLNERWEEGLSLCHVASEVGSSVFHLCRMFRRATGTTLRQYREKLRIRRSLENVIESETPLVDIALETGFSSHSHFTSSFRKEFGQTPSRVRAGTRSTIPFICEQDPDSGIPGNGVVHRHYVDSHIRSL
jgi:AraC family transcriptional regulator